MNTFNFIQWNARSIKANKAFLETALFSYRINCAIISETWLKPAESFKISGYNIIRQDRPDGKGGCCILIKQGIVFSQLPAQIPTVTLKYV